MAKADFINELVSKKLDKVPTLEMESEDKPMDSKQAVAQELLEAIKAEDTQAIVDAIESLVSMAQGAEFDIDMDQE